MHKKQGGVFASLTEVKNKTGDIFAVVDQYGEISITSYNKIRYKITKVDIDTMIGEEPVKTKKTRTVGALASKTEKLDVKKASTVESKPIETKVDSKPVAEQKPEPQQVKKTINVDPWHRDSNLEKDFASKALAPLVA